MRSIKSSNKVWNVFFYSGKRILKIKEAELYLDFCKLNGELLNIGGVDCEENVQLCQ